MQIDAVPPVKLIGSRRDWGLRFVNLLRNAAQVRADAGLVQISATRSLGGALHVDDDGPGVPESDRDRIF